MIKTVDEFISVVEELSSGGWQNSDLWNETEERLEKMAEHYRLCKECAEEFETYLPVENLFELEESMSRNELSDWICDAFVWTEEDEKQLRELRAKKARIRRNKNRKRRYNARGIRI